MNLKTTALMLAGCCAFAHADSIVFTEIMYAPVVGKPEYFVIKNTTQESIDLSGYSADDFIFPPGVYLQPSESIFVSAAAPAETRSAYQLPLTARVVGPNTGVLDDAGDTIIMRNAGSAEVARASYLRQGYWNDSWFVAANGTGHSIVVRDERYPQDLHNWQASHTNRCLNPAGNHLGETTPILYGDAWQFHTPAPTEQAFSNGRYSNFIDNGWLTGVGLFGFTTAPEAIPAPGIQTPVGVRGPDMVYQFRKTFTFNGDPVGAELKIDQIVDDGVRYYLNGQLLGATRLPAIGSWRQAAFGIPSAQEEIEAHRGTAWGLVQGTNVLLAEVHQWVSGSSDMVFGARVQITSRPPLRLSETHFNSAGVLDWVELENPNASIANASGLFLASRPDFTDKISLTGTVAANGFASWDVTLPDGQNSATHTTIYLIDAYNNVLGANRVQRVAPVYSMQAVWPVSPPVRPATQLLDPSSGWYYQLPTRNASNAQSNVPFITFEDRNSIGSTVKVRGIHQGQVQYHESGDPDNGPLDFHWSIPQAPGVDFNLSGPRAAEMGFHVPGIYSFSLTASDDEGTVTTENREILVADADDMDDFKASYQPLGNRWNKHTWIDDIDYSHSGRTYNVVPSTVNFLLMTDTGAMPLDSASLEPASITQVLPWSDFAIQLTVSTYAQPDSLVGLYLKARGSAATGPDYVIGLENGALVVRRLNAPGEDLIYSQPYASSSVPVRVCLEGNHLRFEYFKIDYNASGHWTTVITEDAPLGFESAGPLVAGPTGASGGFKGFYLANPNNHPNSLVKNLRLTEIGPDYRELTNIGGGTLDLSTLTINGVNFPANMMLAAGKSVVIVANVSAYTQAHGTRVPVFEVAPLNFSYANQNAEFDLQLKDSPLVFFKFRPALSPNLFPAGTAFEVIDPSGDNASFHAASNWRAVSGSPGSYLPFTPNDNDSFALPTLNRHWHPHYWSPSRGRDHGMFYSLVDMPGWLILEVEKPSPLNDVWDTALTRPLPHGDVAIQTNVYAHYSGPASHSGLYFQEIGAPSPGNQYVFGIDNSAQLRVQIIGGATLATVQYTPSQIEHTKTLRVMLSGGILSCQSLENGSWITVWTKSGVTAIANGGVYLKGEAGTRSWFSEFLVTNPGHHPASIGDYLKITEVGADFFELTNIGKATLDLSDLAIYSDGTPSWTLPAGTTLAAGASVALVDNAAAFHQKYGATVPVIELANFILNTSGGFRTNSTLAFFFESREQFFGPGDAFEVLDPRWRNDRSNWRAATPSPGVYVQTFNHLTMEIASHFWDVALGEKVTLDASHNYDPEGYHMEYGWWNLPNTTENDWPGGLGYRVMEPTFQQTGIFNVSFTAGNGYGRYFTVEREVTVAHPSDMDGFSTPSLREDWTVHNAVQSDNGEAEGASYSVLRKPGKLVMETNSAFSLTRIGNDVSSTTPCILRELPGENSSVQVNVGVLQGYDHFTGLFVRTQGGQGNQYAFVINSNHFKIYRSVEGVSEGAFVQVYNEYYPAATDPAYSTGLRIRATAAGLQFEVRENSNYQSGFLWRSIWADSTAQTLSDGGPVLFSPYSTRVNATFDDFIVVDPSNLSTPKDSLKVTKFGPNFFELTNLGLSRIELGGIRILSGQWGGPEFVVPYGTRLAAGESIHLTSDASAFRAQFGANLRVLESSLFNAGDLLRIYEVGSTQVFLAVDPVSILNGYNNPAWMEIINPFSAPDYYNWRASTTPPSQWQDSDGDGISDRLEMKFGADPHNASSRHHFGVTRNGSGQAALSWSTTSAQSYQVEYCDTLGSSWQTLTTVIGDGNTLSYADPTNPKPAQRFYRVVAP